VIAAVGEARLTGRGPKAGPVHDCCGRRLRRQVGLLFALAVVSAVRSTIRGPSVGPGHTRPARVHWLQWGDVSSHRIRRVRHG
jgi:hypothetical protein